MRKLLTCCVILIATAPVRAESITVSAAISLKESLTAIESTYEKQTGDKVEFNFGASGALSQQIEQGAPVDGFISAANKQVDDLIKAGKAVRDSKRIIILNSIVLIAPTRAKTTFASFDDLTNEKIKRIAIGQPRAVPAGQYAEQTLKSLKLLEAVREKLVYGANVRQVLDYVQRGEVDAGIVYATDAKHAGDAVKTIATAEANSHEPIEYPAVIITGSAHAGATKRFFEFLASDVARAVFLDKGFELPSPAPLVPPATTRPAR